MIVTGIVSGDCECWCLLVDAKTFRRVTGNKPEPMYVGCFAKKGNPYRYRLYPSDLIQEFVKGKDGLELRFKGKLVALSMEAAILSELKASRKCGR